MEVAMTRVLALVAALTVLTGCSNGPYCDERPVARCADAPNGADMVALCTLDGEAPDWANDDPDWQPGTGAEPLHNGTEATCDAVGNITCRTRADWSAEQHRQLVLGCFCWPGACAE